MLASMLMASAQEAVKVVGGDAQHTGITYSLPKTQVKIVATAQCTQIKAGVYAQFAEKLLGITNAPLADETRWEICGVTLEPIAVPDESKTFHLNCYDKTISPKFYLTSEGGLWSVNKEPIMVAPVSESAEKPEVSEKTADEAEPTTSLVLTPADVLSEELLKAGSKAKQAEIAARQIFRIRESRMDLLTGDVDNLPADGASYQLVLNNLKAQEDAYLQLFMGTTVTTTTTREFMFFPIQKVNAVLFRFSRHFGFVDADDLSGQPFNVQVEVLEDKTQVPEQRDAKGRVIPTPAGVAYTVPGKVRVNLVFAQKVLGKQELQVGQLGHVEYLPAAQFINKKAPKSAQFNTQTGALISFE